MRSGWSWIGWGMALGLIGLGAWGAEPDPEEVRRRMEIYMRDEKPAPVSKPTPKPAPTVNYDHEAWKSAEKCGTMACFRAYLEEYPKGRYARMARARLESETESRPPAAERPKLPSRPNQRLLADRYKDNGDGTVTDVQTGLQWMRCSLGQTWRGGTCIGEAESYTWQAALDAADALNRRGGYASYRDWRVPKKEELQTLIYCSSGQPEIWKDTEGGCEGNYERPTIYKPAFPNTPPRSWYWSSSVYAYFPDPEWQVNFGHGNVDTSKGSSNHVRLARNGQ